MTILQPNSLVFQGNEDLEKALKAIIDQANTDIAAAAAATKGDTGTTGAKGDTGATGAKGDTGVKGDTGAGA